MNSDKARSFVFSKGRGSAMTSMLEKAKHHVWFHHHSADGFVTVARKLPNGRFQQYHYKPEELAEKLSEWLGEDVYFSQNTFYKPSRKIENVRQIRALYVDVDFYLFNLDKGWVLGNVELLVHDREIPQPNLIIHSGQGIVCIWFIEPVPYKALPLWNVLQHHFLEKLKQFGGDSKASDVTRVFRIAGSINSKNGELVDVDYFHDYRYELRDLQGDYLPELAKKQEQKKGRKPKIVRIHAIRQLHHARLLDVVKLVELRNYDVKGHRELILFLYRYWSCCFLEDTESALAQTLELNQEFREPLDETEVVKATKSAEKAWEAKSDKKANEVAIAKGYPGAGYNLKNSTIIEWLDITGEEQQELRTIISGNEKRRRKRIANREMRRKNGIRPMEEYNAERKADKKYLLEMMARHLERSPSLKGKDLARLLGVSPAWISRLKKDLK